jgi:membrane dipeptidase
LTAADLGKLRNSGITVFHPAVELNASDPYPASRRWLNDWTAFIQHHADVFLRVDRTQDLDRAKAEGKIGILLGLQNSEHFRSLGDIWMFYDLGQRVSQLTYNSRNLIGNGCVEQTDEGLTEYGAAVVATMNRVGMAIDVSHSGDRTTQDAIEASRKPVLISHANCRALVPYHPRCKSDEVIRKMASRGSVMGITGIRGFVRGRGPTTVEHALDHFDHVARLVGVEHVGVGSDNDLDGRDSRSRTVRFDINGLNHPRRMFDLTEGLVRRKYSDSDIELILGGNFRRVLREIWAA